MAVNEEFISGILSICEAYADEPMSRHTTFRIGGPADVLAEPASVAQLKAVIDLCREKNVPFTVIGRGSNVLVSDGGVKGAVIKIGPKMSTVRFENGRIYAEAGATLASVYSCAYANGFAGFEKLAGIPGFVGGAIRMNAGAYGIEIKDVLESCDFLENGELKTVSAEEAGLSYRHSIFCDRKDAVIVSAVFKCENRAESREEILREYLVYSAKRRESQPLNMPSAGSTFKRPANGFASRLIDEAGLKGFRIGDAEVSTKHAGFVVNRGGATAEDVLKVIEAVRKTVFEKTGVTLDPEIVYLE